MCSHSFTIPLHCAPALKCSRSFVTRCFAPTLLCTPVYKCSRTSELPFFCNPTLLHSYYFFPLPLIYAPTILRSRLFTLPLFYAPTLLRSPPLRFRFCAPALSIARSIALPLLYFTALALTLQLDFLKKSSHPKVRFGRSPGPQLKRTFTKNLS